MKKITSIFLVIIMLFSLLTISMVTVNAETFTDDNGISWTVTKNYPGWAITPADKSQIVGEITVPATYNGKVVTYIPDSAFAYIEGPYSLTIPDSITIIGSEAFEGSGITKIKLPDTITSIGWGLFNGSDLEEIDYPANLKYIQTQTFSYCEKLRTFTGGESVTELYDFCFLGCKSLESLSLMNRVVLGYQCFQGANIGVLDISCDPWYGYGEQVAYNANIGTLILDCPYIDKWSFHGCNIGNIVLRNVIEVDRTAFDSSVTLPEGGSFVNNFSLEPEYIQYKYTYTYGIKWSVADTENGVYIKPYSSSKTITSITVPSTVVVSGIEKPVYGLGDMSFYGWSKLKNVTLPDGLKYIGTSCFYNTAIESITIPESVESMGNTVFWECYKLKSANIPSNWTEIPNGMFYSCSSLQNVNIPNTVTRIGWSAFRYCSSISNIDIPSEVKEIGANAFEGCRGISNVVIPKNVNSVGQRAFAKMGTLNSVVFPRNTGAIEVNTFYDTSIANLNIDNIKVYSSPLLSGGQIIGNIVLDDDVVITNKYAFYGNDNMSITTPVTNTNVINYAKKNRIPLTISNGIVESGSSKDAIVTLTTERSNLRVTVPTILPVSVDSDNNITVADNAQIINSSRGQIDVTNAVLSGNNSWTLAAFDTDFKKVPVDTKQYGFKLQGYNVPVSGNAYNNQFDTIDGGAALDLSYDANVAIQSEAISDAEIGNIVFTVAWHK